MRPLLLATLLGSGVALVAVPGAADDPPKKLTPAERKEALARWDALTSAGFDAFEAGKYADAQKSFAAALDLARRLYPKEDFPDGHANLARSMRSLGFSYRVQGKFVEAEVLYKDALDVTRRLHKGDHLDLTRRLNDLGNLYRATGKHADAEALLRDSLEMTRRLFKGDRPEVANSLTALASVLQSRGKLVEAAALYKDALDTRKRLHPGQDDPGIADSMFDLGLVYLEQGKYADAETLYKEGLAMRSRLAKGDDPDVAAGLTDLAALYSMQGKYADAEPVCRDALTMRKRLFKGDHPDVAAGLSDLAGVCKNRRQYAEAEAYARDALAMYRRVHPGDHWHVASAIKTVASLLESQRKLAEAGPLYKDALDMQKRLFKGDHPTVADGMAALASAYESQNRSGDAEPLHRAALDMQKRLHPGQDCAEVSNQLSALGRSLVYLKKYDEAGQLLRAALDMNRRLNKGDHPDVAFGLNGVAFLCIQEGKFADAVPLYAESLDMLRRVYPGDSDEVSHARFALGAAYLRVGKSADAVPLLRSALESGRRRVQEYATQKAEGEALTYLAAHRGVLDVFLSAAAAAGVEPAAIYAEVWREKGLVARIYEQRQLQARAASADPRAAGLLADLADARRRRAELLLAPKVADPATAAKRRDDLRAVDERIVELDGKLRPLLPAVARGEKLAASAPADLRKALPADAAVIDFLRHAFGEYDPKKPGKEGETRTERYAAFVVTPEAVRRVDLGPADKIEAAVARWREAITTAPFTPAADLPAKVRELVWEPVRGHLPAGVKAVYVSPDADLARVPWAALPGDRPGAILLEDFAVAAIPHGPFLLDTLSPPEARKGPPAGLLAVGGVAFGVEPDGGALATRTRGDFPADPKKPLAWDDLPGTRAEVEQVARRAEGRKLGTRVLTGRQASADGVLAELPKARYAHLATHGFFADPQFRSVLRVDPADYERAPWGEAVGRGALSPLVLSGLVFAGANRPATPGRGILTGEVLTDRDLSGLELAVLSACETGLGEAADREGVFGLQRAFHVAGTRNVVASLWKVPDAATAALMGEFYRNLWDEKLPPAEALRRAQLAVYRADPKQFADMARRGPGLGDQDLDATARVIGKAPVNPGGRNPPVVWAAWTLSGPGR